MKSEMEEDMGEPDMTERSVMEVGVRLGTGLVGGREQGRGSSTSEVLILLLLNTQIVVHY